jgi:hypothetical protein
VSPWYREIVLEDARVENIERDPRSKHSFQSLSLYEIYLAFLDWQITGAQESDLCRAIAAEHRIAGND